MEKGIRGIKMYGVMKGKNMDRGNAKNKPVESKIIKKQIAPVIQMAPKDVVVIGSTHVVEMIGHSLFNGREGSHLPNQGIFLRQGTRVVIDDETIVLSRRGPNQRLFREEDRDRRTHIYRWVRVVAIDGKNVLKENLYIREGTFREETLMAGRVLSPPSGGVRPSIEAAPGTRHKPLLRPRRAGEEGQDILTPEQRSLNRLARGEWITINGDNKTPHLAMMVWEGKVHVAGNTDKAILTKNDFRDVIAKLEQLLSEQENEDVSEDIRAKRGKMYRKMQKIEEGKYHADEYQNNEIMRVIRNAIIQPESYIKIIGINEAEEIMPKKGKRETIHGEMLILDILYTKYKNMDNGGINRQQPRKRLKKVFAGGNLQDCIFCHWAFDIFNRVIGNRLGVIVVSSGTHGHVPGKWRIPRWMSNEEEAMGMLRERIERLNTDTSDGGRYEIKTEGVQQVLTYNKSGRMKDTMLDASDSDVEE